MFEFLAEKITQVLETKNIIVRDRAIYKYGIETWISALASILLLLVVGIIFNCILEVIIYEAVFFILRRFTGGYYCTTHFECMSLYIAIFTLYMVLREYLKILKQYRKYLQLWIARYYRGDTFFVPIQLIVDRSIVLVKD